MKRLFWSLLIAGLIGLASWLEHGRITPVAVILAGVATAAYNLVEPDTGKPPGRANIGLRVPAVDFEAIYANQQHFEVCLNDTNFQIGDLLKLLEYDESGRYTGRYCYRKLAIMQRGDRAGIEPGYCVLGFSNAFS